MAQSWPWGSQVAVKKKTKKTTAKVLMHIIAIQVKSYLKRSGKWGKLVSFTLVAHYHYHCRGYSKCRYGSPIKPGKFLRSTNTSQ